MVPTFAAGTELVRFIEPEHYGNERRARSAAFIDDDALNDPKYDGLSVNSLEIHTRNQIAAIYELKKNAQRPIALSIHAIEIYNTAAEEAGFPVRSAMEGEVGPWIVDRNGQAIAAYKYDKRDRNESHCLVAITCCFTTTLHWLKFARRLAHRPRYEQVFGKQGNKP